MIGYEHLRAEGLAGVVGARIPGLPETVSLIEPADVQGSRGIDGDGGVVVLRAAVAVDFSRRIPGIAECRRMEQGDRLDAGVAAGGNGVKVLARLVDHALRARAGHHAREGRAS